MSPSRLKTALDLASLSLFQVLICQLVRSSGFLAISDDDYARVVLAQNWVLSPGFDPTHSSWLPAPFFLTGSFLSLFGRSLEVARSSAIISSCIAIALLYRASQHLRLTRTFAILACIVAAILPYSAYLATATVPEYLTAAALILAICQASHAPTGCHLNKEGAFALSFAAASRYEAWPILASLVALSVICHVQIDKRQRKAVSKTVIPCCIAFAFPALWFIHGIVNHNDALFFLHRVIDYKLALSELSQPISQVLDDLLAPLLFSVPEVTLSLVVLTVFSLFSGSSRDNKKLILLWLSPLILIVTLAIGALRGGAPTHHPERSFLAAWLLAVLSIAWLMQQSMSTRNRWFALLALGIALLSGGAFRFSPWGLREPVFTNRVEEERIGSYLLRHPELGTVSLLLQDYGYLAIQAASGQPERFVVLRNNDPRLEEATPSDLSAKLSTHSGAYVIDKHFSANTSHRVLLETTRLQLLAPALATEK